MKTTHTTFAAITLAGAALLTGCASNTPMGADYYPQQSYPQQSQSGYYPSQSQSQSASYGTIDSIQLARVSSGSSGAGAVAGGVVGALLGNQVGSGSGRSAATVAGAVGGALVGNEVEKNRSQGREAYQIGIRLDNGDYRVIAQDSVQDLRVGNRVRVVDGRVYRY